VSGLLAGQPTDSVAQLLVARMRVDDRRQRRDVACKTLRQEEVARRLVHGCDGAVAERVERVEAIETGLLLPGPKEDLHPAFGNAVA